MKVNALIMEKGNEKNKEQGGQTEREARKERINTNVRSIQRHGGMEGRM